jgi:hypothetical protein
MNRGVAMLALVLACAVAMDAQPAACAQRFADVSSHARPAVLMGDGHRVCEAQFLPDECAVPIGRHTVKVGWPYERDPELATRDSGAVDPFAVTETTSG